MSSPRQLVWSVLAWPVETQLGSRRNALVASTALARLRRERQEVEDFLTARFSAHSVTPETPGARRDVI